MRQTGRSVVILSPAGAKDLSVAKSLSAEMLRFAQHDKQGADLELTRFFLAQEHAHERKP